MYIKHNKVLTDLVSGNNKNRRPPIPDDRLPMKKLRDYISKCITNRHSKYNKLSDFLESPGV